MPPLTSIRKEDIQHIFDNVEAFRKYVRSNKERYDMRKLGKQGLIDKVTKDRNDDMIKKNKQLEDAGINARVYTSTQIPIVKDLPLTKRANISKKIRDSLDDIDASNGYNPRFIQLHLKDLFRKVPSPKHILTSKEQGNIIKLLKANANAFQSAFVKSPKEAKNYKNKIRRALKTEYQLSNSKNDIADLDSIMDQLKFVEYVINKSDLDNIDLIYTINGRVLDYTQHIVDTCSHEPNYNISDLMPNDAPLNCFIACILHQNEGYFSCKRRRELLNRNKRDFTLTDIEQVAKDFKLFIKIFDCGGDAMAVYDYKSRNIKGTCTSSKNKNICIIIHNGHVKCLNKNYRTSDAHNNNNYDSLSVSYVDRYITRLDEESNETLSSYYNYKIGATCKVKYGSNGEIVKLSIKSPHLQHIIDYKEIDNDYVIYMDANLSPYMEFLVGDGIIPSVLGDADNIICLSIRINKHTLQLRSGTEHELIDLVPYTHNHTLGSSVMYMFRHHLKSSLMKISDPVIAKIMKHMCRPTIYMKQVNISRSKGKRIYLIDLKRAYRNNCASLGSFKDEQPVFNLNVDYETSYVGKTDIDKIKDGIYELYSVHHDKTWVTHDELKYRVQCGEHLRYRYYVLYTDTTDVLSSFADYIDDPDSPFGDIDSKCRKNAFNILVGKLNPNINSNKSYSIFKNKMDLDWFLLKGDKKIYSIIPICADDEEYTSPGWIVEYAHDNDENYMIGPNASYLSAQIINRCKLAVRKVSDRLEKDGCEIIGSMTDSIIFAASKSYDIMNAINDAWTVEVVGDSIISKGVGQYQISRGGKIVHDRHQGYTSSLTNDMFLELMVRLARRVGNKTFHSVDVDKWVNQRADHKLIIGKAGYGKSTYIRQNYSKRQWVRCAYTNLAASEIEGHSICGLFGLGPTGDNSIETAIGNIKTEVKRHLLRARGLVIDEYYTISRNIMKSVCEILKFIRGSSLPFGGMDLILCGDDRQTAAIGKPFVGSSLYKTIVDSGLERIELAAHDNMRLTYTYDIYCSKFRKSKMDTSCLMELLSDPRLAQTERSSGYAVYYTNEEVNARNLADLKRYKDANPNKACAIINDKEYCVGCPVIILNNEVSGFYNGSLATFGGVLTDVNDTITSVILCTDNCATTTSIEKIHMNHAFAMTIHRAQCKTFPGINIYIRQKDINNSDRDNLMRLLYTAMTRVRDFGDCYIKIIDS